uniref:Thioredoxin, mitochondrial n=1 Tax=Cacopsylla melanoneura TaxID=428564 RepID=A0A8D9B5P9_9HEMI
MFATKLFHVTPKLISVSKCLPSRSLSISSVVYNSFKVQDMQDFENKVKNASTPVIVDFFATWCNPCKTLTPRLESVIDEMKGKVVLAKVDIDELTDLAMDYEVSAVPVLIAMKNGKETDRLVGLQDVDKLKTFIENSLEKKSAVNSP